MDERLEKMKMVAVALERAARAMTNARVEAEKINDLPTSARKARDAWELTAKGWATLAGEIAKTIGTEGGETAKQQPPPPPTPPATRLIREDGNDIKHL